MPFSCSQADYHMKFAHRSSARRHELFYVRCFKPHTTCASTETQTRETAARAYMYCNNSCVLSNKYLQNILFSFH